MKTWNKPRFTSESITLTQGGLYSETEDFNGAFGREEDSFFVEKTFISRFAGFVKQTMFKR